LNRRKWTKPEKRGTWRNQILPNVTAIGSAELCATALLVQTHVPRDLLRPRLPEKIEFLGTSWSIVSGTLQEKTPASRKTPIIRTQPSPVSGSSATSSGTNWRT
jgi:hypothetical protein